MRSTKLSATHRSLLVGLALVFSLLGAAAPATAEHKARLSADLADHLRAGSPSIDVIVHGTRDEAETLARRYSVRIRKVLRSGAVLRVTAGELEALRQDEAVDHLSADIRYRSAASVVAESIGADQVWAGTRLFRGLTGRGIGVAVIDSGVDPRHAALAGRIAATVDFTGGDGIDRFGHGTHVAATIAGAQGRLADTRDHRGIAPSARIINLRVLGEDGSGLASNVIEAIDWAIENRKAHNIRVINLSLGAPVLQSYRDDPVCEAVERAVAAGIVVVAAAGNFGMNKDGHLAWGGITSPANHPSVITVGAIDTHGTAKRSDDTVARYSSRGPTRYDLVLKPDLVAPGSAVVSAEAAGSYLSKTYPERHVTGAGADAYIQLSGTSMAAAVVSGAVALVLEEGRSLGPRDTKAVIQHTSSIIAGEGLIAVGAGTLNVLAATKLLRLGRSSPTTNIAGERVQRSGVSFNEFKGNERAQLASLKELLRTGASGIVWSTDANDTIIWSTNDTILWSLAAPDTIIWSMSSEEGTIIWSTTTIDTIIWSASEQSDTIIWSSSSDTIIWSTFSDDLSFIPAEDAF
jgi:serine protease AprX